MLSPTFSKAKLIIKTTLFIFLSLLIYIPVEASSCQSGLKVGWDTWEPFHYKDEQGQMQGYAVQVLNEMAKRSQCKLNYVQRPWKRTLAELAKGEVDIAMEALKTPEREQFARFSEPYSPTTIQIYQNTRAGRSWKISSLKDIEQYPGTRIGIARGDSFGREIDQWLAQRHPGITLDIAPTMHANLQKLAHSRIDLVFVSSISAAQAVKALQLSTLSPLSVSWTIDDAHFAFSKVSVNDATFQALNRALENMRKDGKLRELSNQYRH